MPALPPPVLLAPEALPELAASADVLLLDMREPDAYAAGHLPGAVNLPYLTLVREAPPAAGFAPYPDVLADCLGRVGYSPQRCVVGCDEGISGKAGRLLWTLAAIGHPGGMALIDGGVPAALDAGLPLADDWVEVEPRTLELAYTAGARVMADREWVLAHLGDPSVLLLDTRTIGEYTGQDRRAARGGHIPGAVHLDWTRAFDPQTGRCKPEPVLRAQFEAVGATPDREIVVYCQTHHRSAHTWAVLTHLGYPRVRGYAGAWSEWGNTPGLPIET